METKALACGLAAYGESSATVLRSPVSGSLRVAGKHRGGARRTIFDHGSVDAVGASCEPRCGVETREDASRCGARYGHSVVGQTDLARPRGRLRTADPGRSGAVCDKDERVRSLASIAYVVLGYSSPPSTTTTPT